MGVLTPDFTPEELTALCERLFPDRPRRRVEAISPLNSWQHQVVSFKLVWWTPMGWASEVLVVRRYCSRLSWWRTDDHDKAKREALMLPWLGSQGVPVPRFYAREDGPIGEVVVIGLVPGESWWALHDEMAEAIKPYVDEFARMLSVIHTLKPPGEVQRMLPAVSLAGILTNMQQIAQRANDAELLNAVMLLLTRANNRRELPPTFLHGDYHFANVLLDKEHISAVLDWEYSALGDPRWDVMNAYVSLVEFGAEAAADRFLETYARYSGIPLENASLWRSVIALQTWALAAWLRSEQNGGHNHDFMMAHQLLAHYHAHRERALRIIAGEPW